MKNAVLELRPEELLEHAAWMGGLARRLVLEGDRVDDVVQEAWAAALERHDAASEERGGLRAWLGAVVRNRALLRRRSDGRRGGREERAAKNERLPSTAELVERADLQRLVVERVGTLPAKYREVVLLRFFEDLKPAAIARRLGVPVETVRTRLSRAYDLLRDDLDRLHGGDRTAWSIALLPLAALDRTAKGAAGGLSVLKTSSLGAWIMLHPITSFALVLVVAAALFGLRRDRPVPPNFARQETAAQAVERLRVREPGRVALSTPPTSLSTTSARSAMGSSPVPRPPAWIRTRLAVEVYDLSGYALPRFRVSTRRSGSSGDTWKGAHRLRRNVTTYTGRTELELDIAEPTELEVGVVSELMASATRTVTLHPGTDLTCRFDVDPYAAERVAGRFLRGHVFDRGTREPVAGALLHVNVRAEGGSYRLLDRFVQTRLDGSFEVGVDEDIARAAVGVAHPYYPFQEFVELDCKADAVLEVSAKETLTVQVVDEEGRPVQGAHLLVGATSQRAGSSRKFGPWTFGDDAEQGFDGIVGADDSRSRETFGRRTTGQDGTATFRHLGPGRHPVFLLPHAGSVDDFALSRHSVRIRPGEDRSFTLRTWAPDRVHVTGRVERPGTACPLAPLFLPLRSGEGGWVQSRPLSEDGYDAGGVPRGTYLVLLVPVTDDMDGPIGFVTDVEIVGVREQQLDLALPTGSLEGTVQGAVPEDARVVVRPVLPDGFAADFVRELGSLAGARPDENGRFRAEFLSTGPHRVRLVANGEVLAVREVEIVGATRLGPWIVEQPPR